MGESAGRTLATMECTRCSEQLMDSARELCCGCLDEGDAAAADACDSGSSFIEACSALLLSDMLLRAATPRGFEVTSGEGVIRAPPALRGAG